MSRLLQALRTAGVVALAAVMLLCITHLSAADPEPAKNDEPKKEEVKKEEPKKEDKEVTNEELRKLVDQLRQEVESLRREVKNLTAPFPTPTPGPRFGRPPQGGRLGVSIDRLGEVLAEHLNLEKNTGLLLTDVVDESAAAKAGLKPHDILVEFGGKPVPNSPAEFARMVEEAKANTPLDAVVIRKGKRVEIKGISLPEPRPIRRGALLPPRQVVVLPMTFCR
jgi:serine protease Do